MGYSDLPADYAVDVAGIIPGHKKFVGFGTGTANGFQAPVALAPAACQGFRIWRIRTSLNPALQRVIAESYTSSMAATGFIILNSAAG